MRRDRESFVDVVRDQHERRARRAKQCSISVNAAPPAASSPVYGSSSSTTRRLVDDRRARSRRAAASRGSTTGRGVSARSAMRMRSSASYRRRLRVRHAVEPRGELHVLTGRERAVEHALMRDQSDLLARRRVIPHRAAVDRDRSLASA